MQGYKTYSRGFSWHGLVFRLTWASPYVPPLWLECQEKLDLEADGKIYTSRRVLTHPGLVKVQEPTGHAIHPGRRRQALLPGRQEEIGALQHVRELKEKGPPQ
eukprot:g15719.t1